MAANPTSAQLLTRQQALDALLDLGSGISIDNNGDDRLSEVQNEDGVHFISSEPGYLILTFPNTGDGGGFEFFAAQKQECLPPADPAAKVVDGSEEPKQDLTAEILGANNEWIQLGSLPTRENLGQTIVVSTPHLSQTSDVVTIRLSWEYGYETYVIRQLLPAEEEVTINSWPIATYQFATPNEELTLWNGFDQNTPLVLKKGETFEFTFNIGEIINSSLNRDYIIVATGRYEPDYSIYSDLLPNTIILFNNYPNPFNPTTTISYSLPEAGKVNLEVFNILGQSVGILVDEYQVAGLHRVEWSAEANRPIASGLYIYRLTAGDFTETKKMMLLK